MSRQSVAVVRRRLVPILALACATLPAGCKTVRFDEAQLFRPRPCSQPSAGPVQMAGSFQLREITIPAEDSAHLQLLLLERPNPRGVLLFFGGNEVRHCAGAYAEAADAKTRAFLDHAFALGLDVVLVNYRGYGASHGKLTIAKGKADAVRVFDALERDAPLGGLQRIVHGQSIGAVFAAALAAERPVAGLVLESPPTNFSDVLRQVTPWYARLMVRVELSQELLAEDSRTDLPRVTAPVLVMVGSRDRVTPPAMARRVYSAAQNAEFWMIPEGSHGDLVHFASYWSALAQFTARVLGPPHA
jgi:hypothetical protein